MASKNSQTASKNSQFACYERQYSKQTWSYLNSKMTTFGAKIAEFEANLAKLIENSQIGGKLFRNILHMPQNLSRSTATYKNVKNNLPNFKQK